MVIQQIIENILFISWKNVIFVLITNWKSVNNLIICIGKVYFIWCLYLYFVEQPDAIELFSEQKGAKDLLLRLSAFAKKPLVPGKTLIFFDEVQECKEIVTAIKFLVDEDSFLWLRDAGVAIPAYNVEEPRVPLLLNKQRNLFKLFLNDVGLLAAMYGGNIQTRLLSPNPNINFGSVFENLVAQELYAHGFSEAQQHSLYYFNSKKQGELDFVVEYAGNMLPIEVKSGKDYERHNALSNVMENKEYAVPMAYVFCQENVKTKDRVIYYPIYMITFFEQVQVEEKVYKFDLTGL